MNNLTRLQNILEYGRTQSAVLNAEISRFIENRSTQLMGRQVQVIHVALTAAATLTLLLTGIIYVAVQRFQLKAGSSGQNLSGCDVEKIEPPKNPKKNGNTGNTAPVPKKPSNESEKKENPAKEGNPVAYPKPGLPLPENGLSTESAEPSSEGGESSETKKIEPLSESHEVARREPIPPRFSELFKEIPQFSGTDRHNLLDKYICVLSNEWTQPNFFEDLAKRPSFGNVGVFTSCMFSLDIASARNLDYLIVIDISNAVEKFWIFMEDAIKKSSTPEEFKNQFTINYKDCDENLKKRIDIQQSWLSNPERFHKIKTIFDNHRFAFLKVDYTNSSICTKIGEILQKNDLKIDTIYISNINEFKGYHQAHIEVGRTTEHAKIVNPQQQPPKKQYLLISAPGFGQGGPEATVKLLAE